MGPVDAREPVVLPRLASGAISIVASGGVRASIELAGAREVEGIETSTGVRFADALGRGTAFEIVRLPNGFEDFAWLERAPPSPTLVYRVALDGVAGLRLVQGALELLDRGGAPRLRMSPPFAVDRDGARHRLPVAIEGCSVDTSPAPPWGRQPIAAGAAACDVVVDLGALAEPVKYPLLVDPTWTTTSSTAEPRTDHAAITLASGRVLVAGRSSSGFVDAEIFDPASSTFAVVSPMLEPRSSPALAPLGEGAAVLVIGGKSPCDGCGAVASVEMFDETTGFFSPMSPMTTARVAHSASTLADGRVLVAGGNAGGLGAPHLASSEIFDPPMGMFVSGPSLVIPRSGHTATALPSGDAIIVGGAPGPKMTELFDAGADAFVPAGDLAERRTDHAAALLSDGRVLVAGGRVPSSADDVLAAEIFDPSARADLAWSSAGTLVSPHAFGTLTALSGGRALMVGGCCVTAAAELFDPVASAWNATSSLETGRSGHAAAPLSTTTVLVIGGRGEAGALATAEVFALSANGDPCDDALACGSGFCVDAVCCDSACDATCEGCSSAVKGGGESGFCAPVTAGLPDPRGVCAPAVGPCGAAGLCASDGGCQPPPAGAPCGEEECPSGLGACTEEGTCECAPVVCDADGHSLGDADCSPYRCREGACLGSCRSSTECVEGFFCNDDGRCTTAPLPPPDTGCACDASAGPTSPSALVAMVLASMVASRRRWRVG